MPHRDDGIDAGIAKVDDGAEVKTLIRLGLKELAK